MIESALSTIAQHEADQTARGEIVPAPSIPLVQSLVLAIYMHELRRCRRGAPGDARPEQLIRAARDAHVPEHEIDAARDLAARDAAASGASERRR